MAKHKTHEMLVVPGSRQCPRNSEGDIIELKDGRLLLGWTEFHAGEGEDWSTSRLAGKTSADGGITWSETFVVLEESQGRHGAMEVNFQRLTSGDIALFYLRKNSIDDYRLLMRKSTDEGRTWSEPTLLSDWGEWSGLTL